jgi:hypothetical protein
MYSDSSAVTGRRQHQKFLLTRAEATVIILFLFYALAGMAIGWGFAGPWVVHLASGCLVGAGVARAVIRGVPRVAIRAAVVGMLAITYALLFLDSRAILMAGSWWGVCVSYLILFHRTLVRAHIIMWVAMITLVLFVLWTTLGLDAADPGVSFNRLTLVPSAENGFIVNIGPPGSTKHFTATLGGMLFVWSIQRYVGDESLSRPWVLVTLLWAAYLLIFSGSRAAYLGILFATLVILLNKKQVRAVASLGLLGIGVAASYYGVMLFEIEWLSRMPWIVRVLMKATDDNPDFGAGRVWLWSYHVERFLADPFGSGRSFIDQLGVDAAAGLVPASSESWFTALLAIYGVGALHFFVAYLAVFMRALRNRDTEMLAVSMFVIITTATSSFFAQPYGPWSVVVLALVASRWGRLEGLP